MAQAVIFAPLALATEKASSLDGETGRWLVAHEVREWLVDLLEVQDRFQDRAEDRCGAV